VPGFCIIVTVLLRQSPLLPVCHQSLKACCEPWVLAESIVDFLRLRTLVLPSDIFHPHIMSMKITLSFALALVASYHSSGVAAVDSYVHLDYSSYNGVALPNGVTQWLGIRYAAPPLGDLRFAAPQDPPSTGDGIVQADTHGPVCLKRSSSNLPAKLETPDTNEDCLFMDIYAPTNATCGSLPVMFFLQGGGFSILSNANYNGSGLVLASEMNMVGLTGASAMTLRANYFPDSSHVQLQSRPVRIPVGPGNAPQRR
jgi:hypothetical protein